MESEGLGWMRMSERVECSVSRGLHVLACVCLCMHACMQLVDTVALVCMLDSPFAGSVATVVFPWRHCHLLLH